VRNKIKLTEALVKQLPKDNNISLENAKVAWWYNIKIDGGLRLTEAGYDTFINLLNISHYEYTIKDNFIFTKQILLDLDKKLQMPYYIKAKKHFVEKIIFFGSKEAVLANLYGDLGKFLNNY